MRTLTGNILIPDRPFAGQGISVYAGLGHPNYRNRRIVSGRLTPKRSRFRGSKTTRVAYTAAAAGDVELDVTLPAALIGQSGVAIDVRHFRDDCENEVTAPQLVATDGAGDTAEVLEGRAILVATELRSGGDVLFRWRYENIRGNPARFRWHRLSGPTSPADVTEPGGIPGLYESTFSGLSAGTYAFRLTVENQAASLSTTLIASVSVTPDATGPDAVTGLTVEVR